MDSAADGAKGTARPRSHAPATGTRTHLQHVCVLGAEVERSSAVLGASGVRVWCASMGVARVMTLSAASNMARAAISRSTTSE